MKKIVLSLVAACTLLVALLRVAEATTIRYEAINLPDNTPGEDLWQYRYQVSQFTFLLDYGFDILFEVAEGYRFGDLVDPQPPNANWDVMAIQADPNVPDPGRYEAIALIDQASLADFFTLNFIWRGGSGVPGSQRFEVFEILNNNFVVQERGRTIPLTQPIPEPDVLGLVGIGLLGLSGLRLGGLGKSAAAPDKKVIND